MRREAIDVKIFLFAREHYTNMSISLMQIFPIYYIIIFGKSFINIIIFFLILYYFGEYLLERFDLT